MLARRSDLPVLALLPDVESDDAQPRRASASETDAFDSRGRRRSREPASVPPRPAEVLAELARITRNTNDNLRRTVDLISSNVTNAPFFLRLARTLLDRGRVEAALTNFRRAAEIDPQSLEAALGQAEALHKIGDLEQAVEAYGRVLELRPEYWPVNRALAQLFLEAGESGLAFVHLRQWVQLCPHDVSARLALGSFLADLGNLDMALDCFDQGLQMELLDAEARLLRAEVALQRGDWEIGWRQYEWRRRTRLAPWERLHDLRVWNGEDLRGRRVLVRSERSAPLDILFSSCLPQLMAAAERCYVEVHPRLAELFRESFPGCTLIPSQATAAKRTLAELGERGPQMQIFLGSLPRWLHATPGDIPAPPEGHLRIPQERREYWRRRLAADGSQLRVGLVRSPASASGSHELPVTSNEFAAAPCAGAGLPAASDWAPILQTPGVRFFSLHGMAGVRTTAAELARPRPPGPQPDLVAAETVELAAQMAAFDLVIAVPSLAAHLAAASGTPVWVLTPHWPSWCWMIEGALTPWYRRASLFRQRQPGDWGSVMAEAADNLRALVHAT